MPNDLVPHLQTGRRLLQRMSASPCEYIELAFEAERHALETSGADRDALRMAVQTIDDAEAWSDKQRAAFIAYVTYLDERLETR
jgi:hypothetical protein